jgi:hypothetical protein
MSLGPFELVGPHESNPYGHFEAAPFVSLNWDLQFKAFGFGDDSPLDPVTWRRFRETCGQWPSELAIPDSQWQQGKELVHQLVMSGPVSGFKDPRTALTWPFWRRVLQEFPGLRVVPLFLIRSPHEIAMSLFQRVHGDYCYDDALDVTAIHFRRMKGILDEWQGDHAVLQFEPQIYSRQAPKAVEMCGLKWDDAIFTEVYDPHCRHHAPTMIVHEAQSLFEQMGGSEERLAERDNLRQLMADAAVREEAFRRRAAKLAAVEEENRAIQQQLAELRLVEANQHAVCAQAAEANNRRETLEFELREARTKLGELEQESNRFRCEAAGTQEELTQVRSELSHVQQQRKTLAAELAARFLE